MQIPFVDLAAYQLEDLNNIIVSSLQQQPYVKGKDVSLFQEAFTKAVGANHCITTGNGTDALFIALKVLGVQPGDEVITPAFSWISSAETISLCNAKPVFVDVNPHTYTLDPDLIENKITPKTKAIIVVHLYGQAAHLSAIKKICEKHKVLLIEDCAQAHLTQEEGKCVGTFGDTGCFSFYPTKNLGALGDAGCIITSNDTLAEIIRRFANHGALEKDDHLMEGMNSRMDTIQAAVLLAKLPYLKKWNQQRIENAALYKSLLAEVDQIVLPFVRPETTHTFHLFVIRAQARDQLKKFLLDKGVQTLIHYPKALPNLPAYGYMKYIPEQFPVANQLEHEVLSLPIYPGLKEKEITYVADCIKEFYATAR